MNARPVRSRHVSAHGPKLEDSVRTSAAGLSVVVYIIPESDGRDMEVTYRSRIPGKHVMTFDYAVIRVWELEPEKVFKNGLYGLHLHYR